MAVLAALLLSVLGAILSTAQQSGYGQCGGIGWTGATTCISGWTCTELNSYYSQCLPGASSSSASSSTITSSSHSSTSASTTSSSATSTASGSAFPTPVNMSPEWQAAYTKAQAAVAKLSLSDKVNIVTGVGWENGPCVGNTYEVSSIGYPSLCLEDGPVGARYADKVSAFGAEINVAATFNRTLMNLRGQAMGAEFRGKGIHVQLGPMMNLMRAPAAGRNWEGFGADPYLSGEGAFETVTGIQSQGVQACAKHYINNEQEHFRDSSSSNVDDRYEHELYSVPFLRAVQANVAAVMCSYNQINGTYSCENSATLNGLLKGEFGFPGYVMSDWWATHSTVPSANGGLDVTMPGDETTNSGTTYFGQNLINAVNSGSVSQARITDMATRILAAWYLVGQDSGYPAVNFNAWNVNASPATHVNVQADHANLIRTIAAASTVLLKNTNHVLPLNKPKSIALIGSAAGPNPNGPNGCTDRSCDSGVLAMGWGSGTDDFPYLTTPVDAITNRSSADGTTISSSLSDTDLSAAASTASGKDVAFVFITADSGEGYLTVEGNAGDRNDLSAWHSGDALVQKVASVNKNTIVVVQSVGPITMEAWITNANVTAVVWSGLAGQEAGDSLVDILYGAYNPSGRLPYTIGKSITDYPAQILYTSSQSIPAIPYTEGLNIDYRHFDSAGIAPRFEFGFGLSYTTFDYSALTVTGSPAGGTPVSGPGSALNPSLHEDVVSVSFTLANNGTLAGHEVPQLYVTFPASANEPPQVLRGFDSIYLAAGSSTTVTFQLSRFDLSIWNVETQRWEVPSGSFGVAVGASSRDHRLTGSIAN
ncbi:beta-glucosidase [Punctularia strigosozonata HHB-11173 SS5]|uniref:beta-glucosidase n=1 Tax=Punctularia strigosozonata (strain HHB-11173) TaxID=741275 RepID=UPI0004416A78|nr:beta-glucosidase [Punctularia strigosozonata HHB-11173 SS5]EIN13535.1 beta-glucosidase [Punctularia strigosozonata HHB-11173 SS5]